jgi:hypothetical protein
MTIPEYFKSKDNNIINKVIFEKQPYVVIVLQYHFDDDICKIERYDPEDLYNEFEACDTSYWHPDWECSV